MCVSFAHVRQPVRQRGVAAPHHSPPVQPGVRSPLAGAVDERHTKPPATAAAWQRATAETHAWSRVVGAGRPPSATHAPGEPCAPMRIATPATPGRASGADDAWPTPCLPQRCVVSRSPTRARDNGPPTNHATQPATPDLVPRPRPWPRPDGDAPRLPVLAANQTKCDARASGWHGPRPRHRVVAGHGPGTTRRQTQPHGVGFVGCVATVALDCGATTCATRAQLAGDAHGPTRGRFAPATSVVADGVPTSHASATMRLQTRVDGPKSLRP